MVAKIHAGIYLAILICLVAGCSGGDQPVNPPLDPVQAEGLPIRDNSTTQSDRYLIGYWTIEVSEDHKSIDVVPVRSIDMHFNAVRMLEETPCTDCLSIGNVQLTGPNELTLDLIIRHPFTGNLNLTGFDVRGIFISDADYTFPVGGRSIAWGDGLPGLKNADGYTSLFNPTEFPPDSPLPPALKYYPGELSPVTDLSATLNPFIAYSEQIPRRMFLPGDEKAEQVVLHFPTGGFKFGYAVDISWLKPDGTVTDPVADFPIEANCPEAYSISGSLGEEITSDQGSSALLEVKIYDHQGFSTVLGVMVEAPDLFIGTLNLVFDSEIAPDGWLYTSSITNEFGAETGTYPLLVRVIDMESDPNLGQVDAWNVLSIEVTEVQYSDPVAIAGFDPSPQDINVPVNFFDDGSYDPDGGAIVNYEWDWDNNGTFDEEGESVQHTWSTPGIYPVQFKVTDDEGATDTLTEPLSVEITEPTIPDGWAHAWGGESMDWGSEVVYGPDGYLYIVGDAHEGADIDPTENELLSVGMCAFVSKFDTEGNFIWGKIWGESPEFGFAQAWSVAVTNAGDVFVVGTYAGQVDMDPTEVTDLHQPTGGWDMYLSKFTTDGEFLWAKTWGGEPDGTSYQWELVSSICSDNMGNIYLAGAFSGVTDFDLGDGIHNETSNGDCDPYLLKLNTDGELAWVRVWGSEFGKSIPWEDIAKEVRLDSNDNLFVTGI